MRMIMPGLKNFAQRNPQQPDSGTVLARTSGSVRAGAGHGGWGVYLFCSAAGF